MIRISNDVRFAEETDGGILLDIRNDRFFDLNAMGALIWRFAARGESIDQIAQLIADETHVDVSCVDRDVADFLNELAHLDLIVLNDRQLCSTGGAG